MAALRWEPTHVTKPDPRVSPYMFLVNGLNSTTQTMPSEKTQRHLQARYF